MMTVSLPPPSLTTCVDHLQTCQTKSVVSQVHDWVVYKLGPLLGSVGHKVKIHKITPVTGKERGDIEIKEEKKKRNVS